jgi:hypothetical protein
LYPVREDESDEISIGFELLFPGNRLPFDVNFTVRRKTERNEAIVQESDES